MTRPPVPPGFRPPPSGTAAARPARAHPQPDRPATVRRGLARVPTGPRLRGGTARAHATAPRAAHPGPLRTANSPAPCGNSSPRNRSNPMGRRRGRVHLPWPGGQFIAPTGQTMKTAQGRAHRPRTPDRGLCPHHVLTPTRFLCPLIDDTSGTTSSVGWALPPHPLRPGPPRHAGGGGPLFPDCHTPRSNTSGDADRARCPDRSTRTPRPHSGATGPGPFDP